MDYDAPQWLYVSVINIASLVFIFKNKDEFQIYSFPKHVKQYFYLYIGFFIVGCLSMLNAINITESMVHLARLVSIIGVLFCLYIFIRQNPKAFFELVCKIAIFIIIYYSWRAIYYYFFNYKTPRIFEFVLAFPHNFSSVNIYTAFIVIQFPFVIFAFLYFKKIWKYLAGLAVFMAMFALFFSGSRTALLSFLVMFVLLILFIIFGIVKHKIKFKKEITLLVMFFIISILSVLNVNRVDSTKMNTINDIILPKPIDFYKGQALLNTNIENLIPKLDVIKLPNGFDSGRFSLWNLAFSNFIENPILGVGYGNYKAIGKKEHYATFRNKQGNFMSPRRAHSDFIEKLAETGILGFLLFLSLFVFPLLWLFKILRKETQYERQFLFGTVFLSALAYTFDALLNFPLERPPIQLYFLLTVIFVLSGYKKEEAAVTNSKHKFYFPILLLLLGCFTSLASNYVVLKSYQLQRTMREDLMGKTLFSDEELRYSYESIKKQWINYPELSYVGTVNNVYLANYAIKAKKYEEALAILNRSKNFNKDAFLVRAFKAEIYLNVFDNIDSAKYYSKAIFDDYPAFKTNYRLLKSIYAKEKDSANLFRIMNRYTKINRVDVNEWKTKANTVYEYTKDSDLVLKTLDTGLVFNSLSETLIEAKNEIIKKLKFKSYLSTKEVKAKHQLAFGYFTKQKYNEARSVFEDILKTNPKDYLSIQNIGIIDLVEKNYGAAIKNFTVVIDANAFSDGKAEYSRGYCYEQLADRDKAKVDYNKSRSKKYSQAMLLPASKYQ